MLRIGDLTLDSNVLLAPLAGYTDLPFRLVVRSVPQVTSPRPAVGLAFTELLCSNAILHEATKTMWLASTCAEDQPLGMQLYGRDADPLAEAALWAEAHGARIIDLNMGCPVDKVTKRNGGSKLLCEPDHAVRLAERLVRSVRVPVTCKIRLGWDDSCLIGASIAPRLADVGVAAVTVHGRTTEQRFRGSVRLAGIADVVAGMARRHPRVPVIGNGDIKTPRDAERMIAATGCHGVMIGRGALGQPWLFRDTAHLLASGEVPPPLPRVQRARLVLAHLENMLRWRDERGALNTMRMRMSWYSPHLQPWPGLKRSVQQIQSANEMRDYLQVGIAQIARDDAPTPVAA